MTPKALTNYAAKRIGPNVSPLMVLGPPGIGKTAIAGAIAKQAGLPLHHWPVMARQGVDVGGYPTPDVAAGITRFLPAEGLLKAGEAGGILFLDELPQCPETDQPSYLKLVHERLAGEHLLPDTLHFMAAGNRPTDGSGRNRLIEALRERFSLVELEPSAEDWLEWASTARLNALVRDYIRVKRETALFKTPELSRSPVEGSANPRSWHMLANEVDAVGGDHHDLFEIGAGIVGSSAMTDFKVWLSLGEKLINPKITLDFPESAPIPSDPSVLYISCSLLADYAAKMEGHEPINAAAKWFRRLSPEFATTGLFELANAREGFASFFLDNQALFPDVKWIMLEYNPVFLQDGS